jgi:hypothetical protein
MNTYIREAYLQLPEVSRENIRRQFAGSPKMLLLLDFLAHVKQKNFSVHEAVAFIYPEETDKTTFNVLRNRFFKLRKKLAETLESGVSENAGTDVVLLPLEEEYFRCRTLIQNSFFAEARQRLEQLISTCWERNIFELLPDAISQVIFCSAPLNMFGDNPRYYRELKESAMLLNALHLQRLFARQAYEATAVYGYKKASEHVLKMQPVAKQYSKYPRFELYYHFTAFTLGVSTHGNDFRALARHQKRVKELTALHPDMPVGFYEQHSSEVIHYMMSTAEGMHAYQRGDLESSYQSLVESWKLAELVPGLRVRKSESQFANRIAIEIATGRYTEALKTADDMLGFLKDQKDKQKRLRAYGEMLLVYSYAFPKLVPYNPAFLADKVKDLFRLIRENKTLYYNELLISFGVFLLQNNFTAEAIRLARQPEFAEALKQEAMLVYGDIFAFAAKRKPTVTAKEIRKKTEQQVAKVRDISKTASLERALRLLAFLEKQK